MLNKTKIKACRVCLKSRNLRSLFRTFDNNRTFADLLNECTKYQVDQNDELPQQICEHCETEALNAFKFKRKCEQSYCDLSKSLQLSFKYSKTKWESVGKAEKCTQTDQSTQGCETCEENYFSNDAQMMDHKEKARSHLANPSKISCQICKRQFRLRGQLTRHMTLMHKKFKFDYEKIVDDKEEGGFEEIDSQNKSIRCGIEIEDKIYDENDPILRLSSSDNENDKHLLMLRNFQKTNQNVPTNEENEDLEASKTILECNKTSGNDKTESRNLSTESSTNHDHPASDSCTMCTKVFKNAFLPCKDRKARHAIVPEIYCEESDKAFVCSSKYQRHTVNKHKKRSHKCSVCDKTFSSKIYLQRHRVIHERKSYACKVCSQMFVTKEELNTHLKAERHDKPLLCPECGLRCKTPNLLVIHMRRHKGEKPFKCKFCTKGFPRKDDLHLHERYHTGEKSHFCETCGKGFQRKYNLNVHLRVHTGEKPYKCPQCPQAFAQGNDLKAHIRRHTGERFRCEICGAAFLQGYQMRQHKLSQHDIREDPPTQRVVKFTSSEAQDLQIKQNLQKEQKSSTEEAALNGNNSKVDMDSLPLDIDEIQNTTSGILEVSLDVSNFSSIGF